MTIRLAIVDDQGMVRAGFRSLLAGEPDFEVVGEAANGEEARRAGHPAAARRDADGHPDARARRHRRDPAAGRGAGGDQGAGAHHLRPRRVRLRGAARRRLRLPAQGRAGRGARRRDPGGRGGGVAARARGDPAGDRRVRTPARAPRPDARPAARACSRRASSRCSACWRAGCRTSTSPARCSSPRAPPRPTSATC